MLSGFELYPHWVPLKLNDSKAEALWIVFKIGHEQVLVSGKTFKSPKYKVKTRSVAVN